MHMVDRSFDLRVQPGTEEGVTVIAVSGALVLEHVFKFQDAWRAAQGGGLVFDLSGVEYMDSAAIGSLVNAHVACTNRGKKMALSGVSSRVRQMLSVTRVDSLFTFYPDAAAAAVAIKGTAAGA
jgi:anti-anti-sigma factor